MSKKTYRVIRICALVVAAGVLVYASYSLTDSYLNYKDDEKKYAQINDMFVREETVENVDDTVDYSTQITTWTWDYPAMLSYNDESKGYIRLEGTRIQYPIVQHSDNDYYLKTGSDKISNGAGAIFLDYRGEGLDGRMCVLYGHNMMDGSMFRGLMDFRDSDFCAKHQTFDVYVGYRHYIYYVFSAFSVKATNTDIYRFGFEDDEDFGKWIDTVYAKSSYVFENDKPCADDAKIIMCSTCIDNYQNREVVCMYRGEEVVD